MGLGLPFLLAALFISRAMGVMNRLKRHMKWIERAMGALLLIVGVALLTGAFTDFSWCCCSRSSTRWASRFSA